MLSTRGMSEVSRRMPAIALASAVALLLAGVFLAIYVDRATQQQQIDEIRAQARILASTVTAALSFNDRGTAQEYVNATRSNPEVQIAAIYDASGALFVSYSRSGARPPARVKPGAMARILNNRLIVTEGVRQDGPLLGTVYLRSFTEPVAPRMQRYGVIVLLVTMAALLVGVLGAAQAALARANEELERRAMALSVANTNLLGEIEQREHVEAALRQAQKMEVIGQLTGGVAHDFNNLLQVILGNLERLSLGRGAAGGSVEPDFRRYVDAAIRGAERAATLTQRLLAFSRRQPLAPKPLDVNQLVTGMSDLLARTLGETVVLRTVLPEGIWRTLADENQLENAVLNLAVNARDAMPQGGRLTIATANAHLDAPPTRDAGEVNAGDYVAITVTDTGTGMTPEVLAKAFEPFFTTKDIGQGTGLGLSQVYGFVRQSGGDVTITSASGQGTTVALYLPRIEGLESVTEHPPPRQRIPGGSRSELILVVEDEKDVRAFTTETLRELGYGVVEAPDGRAALSMLDSDAGIRMLFTDIGLPGGVNGRELAEEALRRRPHLRVLFTTGYERNAIVHHGRLDPGVALIGKPFTYAGLALKVREVLDAATDSAISRLAGRAGGA
jgi:signal transduction histidine kinase